MSPGVDKGASVGAIGVAMVMMFVERLDEIGVVACCIVLKGFCLLEFESDLGYTLRNMRNALVYVPDLVDNKLSS